MSLAYLILGLVWFIRFVQHLKDVIQLHYHIKVVIGLGMCEMALWYFEYASFDVTGSRPLGITLWASLNLINQHDFDLNDSNH